MRNGIFRYLKSDEFEPSTAFSIWLQFGRKDSLDEYLNSNGRKKSKRPSNEQPACTAPALIALVHHHGHHSPTCDGEKSAVWERITNRHLAVRARLASPHKMAKCKAEATERALERATDIRHPLPQFEPARIHRVCSLPIMLHRDKWRELGITLTTGAWLVWVLAESRANRMLKNGWSSRTYNDLAGRNGSGHCRDATMLRDNPEGSPSRCSAAREFFSSRAVHRAGAVIGR